MLCFPTVTHIITAAGLPSADRKMSNRYSYLSDERRQEVLKTYGESDELANATLVVWEKKNRYVSWLVITQSPTHRTVYFSLTGANCMPL